MKPWPAALALLVLATPARADDAKAKCIAANVHAQDLRRAGKLSASRAELLVCADPACPPLVRDDCSARLAELAKVQPSIVFEVKDPAGQDVAGATITIDGAPAKLDGQPIAVDPGTHTFEIAAPGRTLVTKTMAFKETDAQHERVVMTPSETAPPPPQHDKEKEAGGGMGGAKIAGLAIAGVGVAGIALGSVFGLLAASDASTQKTNCANAAMCPSYAQAADAHSRGMTEATVSTISFVAGGALLAGGVLLFVLAPKPAKPSTWVGLSAAPGGLIVRGGF